MKFFNTLVASLWAFFLPVHGLLIAVALAIFLDTYTGIFKAVKTEGWASVRSRKLSDIVGKVILYNLAVLTMYVLDYHLFGEFFQMWISVDFFFTKIITVVLVVIELTSIKENFEEAYNIKMWPMLRKIVSRSKEIKKNINDLTN